MYQVINQFKKISRQIAPKYKQGIKRILWKIILSHQYKKDEKNIFLFTSRRSGGTWITEAITEIPRIRMIIEPFATGSKDPYIQNIFPNEILESTIPQKKIHEDWMHWFNDAMINGDITLQTEWNPFKIRNYKQTDKVCIKIHMAKHWYDWYINNYPNDKFVYLVRHPIPQSLSSMKLGAKIIIDEYLNDIEYKKDYLSPEMINISKKIKLDGTTLEKYVLNWCLENLVTLKSNNRKLHLVTYEELVHNPKKSFDMLFKYLEHSGINHASITNKPSKTATASSVKSAKVIASDFDPEERSRYLLKRWQKTVKHMDQEKIQNILDIFCIDLYSAYEYLPLKNLDEWQ